MLWICILAVIGVFIFFMPDIERFFFGREKKDQDAGKTQTEEKANINTENENTEKEETNKKKTSIPTKYECSRTTTESFYKETATFKYTYDKKGKTLTVNGLLTTVVDSAESYNQMKNTYSSILAIFDKLSPTFKDYYLTSIDYDDANKTIKVTTKVDDYSKAMKMVEEYNKSHENESISLSVYGTYDETEINMKSDGYTCK